MKLSHEGPVRAVALGVGSCGFQQLTRLDGSRRPDRGWASLEVCHVVGRVPHAGLWERPHARAQLTGCGEYSSLAEVGACPPDREGPFKGTFPYARDSLTQTTSLERQAAPFRGVSGLAISGLR